MEEKRINLEELEKVRFKISKEAFKPKAVKCSECSISMKKKEIEISMENGVFIRVDSFECPKCKKRYLGLEEARKMDRAMIVSKVVTQQFKMRRSLSYDGSNYTFRVPKEFTHAVHKKKIEIVPLGAKEFCALIE